MNNPNNINDILAQAAMAGAQERELKASIQDDEIDARLQAASRGLPIPGASDAGIGRVSNYKRGAGKRAETKKMPADPNARRAAAILSVTRALEYQRELFKEAAGKINTDELTAAAIIVQAFQELMSEKRGEKGIKQVQKRAADIATVWAMGQVKEQPTVVPAVNVTEEINREKESGDE